MAGDAPSPELMMMNMRMTCVMQWKTPGEPSGVKSGSDLRSILNAGRVRIQKQTLKVDSESRLQKVGSETEGSGSMWKGQVKVQGSVSELINTLGGVEGLPA